MRALGLGLVLCAIAGAAQAKTGMIDYALLCQFEISPAGSYEYPAGVSAPVVTPGRGGTQAGADALNDCIRAKYAAAQASQATVIPSVTTAPSGAVKTSRTAGGITTTTYSYGYGEAAPVLAKPAHKPWRNRYSNRIGECSLTFSGGSGYKCSDTARRFWP